MLERAYGCEFSIIFVVQSDFSPDCSLASKSFACHQCWPALQSIENNACKTDIGPNWNNAQRCWRCTNGYVLVGWLDHPHDPLSPSPQDNPEQPGGEGWFVSSSLISGYLMLSVPLDQSKGPNSQFQDKSHSKPYPGSHWEKRQRSVPKKRRLGMPPMTKGDASTRLVRPAEPPSPSCWSFCGCC